MIQFDLHVYIGCRNDERGPLIKCHDSGVKFAMHLLYSKRTSKWRETTEEYRVPADAIAVLRIKKPDKTSVITDEGFTFDGTNVVVCAPPPQAFTAEGVCNAEVSIFTAEGKRLTTATFRYEVDSECVCDGDQPSADYINLLGEHIKKICEESEKILAASEAAEQSANTAKGYAEDAEQSENAAKGYAEDAEASSQYASKMADYADRARGRAAEAASIAENHKNKAKASEENAAQSEESAKKSASSAGTYAESAYAYRQSAEQSAVNANNSQNRTYEYAQKVEAYNEHPPMPSEKGTWMIYNVDTEVYEDSGINTGAYGNWNALDGEPGYIRNRPFGIEWADEAVLPWVVCTPYRGSNTHYEIPQDFTLELSKTYRVVYNGVEYPCETVAMGYDDGTGRKEMATLEFDAGGSAKNRIVPAYDDFPSLVWAEDTPDSVTVAIYKKSESNTAIKKIDPIYLPDDIGAVKTVNGKAPDANGNVQIETGGGGGSDPNAVKYTQQSLTEAQKAQARENIGVVGTGKDGEDYALTQKDKEEIAGMAAELVDVPEGGGAQADWNAAEGEPGHVLNRTHWEESSLVEVLPEWTFISSAGNGQTLKTPLGLTPGKTYIVNWEGAEYKCVAFTVVLAVEAGTTFSATIIGDFSKHSPLAPATGDPFGIFEYDQQELVNLYGAVQIRPNDDTTREYTISITEVNETVHKLDGKYLPNGIPYLEGGGEPVELLSPKKLEEENGAFIVPADAGIVLVDGGNYVVNWNGTEYTCTAQYFEMNGESGIVMGNIGLALGDGEDTGEPFIILYSEMLAAMGASLNVISLAGDTEVTLGLAGSLPVKIHKLDPKLLPDGVPYAVDSYGALLSNYTIEDQAGLNGLPRLGLVAGNAYDVKINGVGEYHCVAVSTVFDGIPFVGIGNVGALTQSGDTGEPFVLVEIPPDDAAALGADVVIYPVGDTITLPVTFSIWGGSKEIRKLDNDCLDLAWLPTTKDTIIVEETTVEHGQPLDGVGFRNYPAGTQLAVRVDGVRYPVTVNSAGSGVDEYFYIGDPNFASTPFLATFSATQAWFYFADEQAHAVSVYTLSANKMPAEFLPDSVATKEYVNEMLGVIENGTY